MSSHTKATIASSPSSPSHGFCTDSGARATEPGPSGCVDLSTPRGRLLAYLSARVDLRVLGPEGVERPEEAVSAQWRVLRDADLDGEAFALAGSDRLGRLAVEDVHLDLALGHELLDVGRAAVEAGSGARDVPQDDDEMEHLAAFGAYRLVRDGRLHRRARPRRRRLDLGGLERRHADLRRPLRVAARRNRVVVGVDVAGAVGQRDADGAGGYALLARDLRIAPVEPRERQAGDLAGPDGEQARDGICRVREQHRRTFEVRVDLLGPAVLDELDVWTSLEPAGLRALVPEGDHGDPAAIPVGLEVHLAGDGQVGRFARRGDRRALREFGRLARRPRDDRPVVARG